MLRARGYRRRFPADIPATGRKSIATRVQEKISRGYTRNRPEKYRRAGTGEKNARIYPQPAGKAPPRGYRRKIPADIPATGRKNTAARVQERKTRGYTRSQPEKRRRAGTGEKTARIYPQSAGKAPPRGYRREKRADIPATGRKNAAARVQERNSRGYTLQQAETYRRVNYIIHTARESVPPGSGPLSPQT